MSTTFKLPIAQSVLDVRLNTYDLSSFDYQKRRHEDWRENYELYRDRVITNRLTQRQTVNIPLMKETIKTILSRTDEAPDVLFESLGNQKQKEIFLNEYWALTLKNDRLILKDIVDKKQVCLYGISWRKLMVYGGNFHSSVVDPHDIIVDRMADPTDIDGTAKYVKNQHLYATISELERNEFYNQNIVGEIKTYFSTAQGIVKANENAEAAQNKADRLRDLGVPDVDNPAVGETIVELSEHYIKMNNPVEGYDEWWVITRAEGKQLSAFPLEYVVGETDDDYWCHHLPFVVWGDDIERTDLYSDGVADIVRQANKVANAWFSQLVENRTLRNFGMNYYDATAADNFVPQTYEPAPWGWYPVPGDPNKIVKKVDIPDLSDSLDELTFLINMVERATAATATEKGQQTQGQVTLGEIKLIAEKALERITSIAKFYRLATEEFAYKWYKMVEANGDYLEPVKLYKKGYRGNYFEQEIDADDWRDEAGYKVTVTSSSEQEDQSIKTIQKLRVVKQEMPDNIPFLRIYQKKLLSLVKLTPEEEREVMEFEKQKMAAINGAMGNGAPGAPLPAPSQPANQSVDQILKTTVEQLA